jgi:hypothetical protein
MLPARREVRDQIEWFVNGCQLDPADWICTQYVGRDRLYRYDFDSADLVLWEARIPKPVFYEMYRGTYEQGIDYLQHDPEAAALHDRRSAALRQLGFPPLPHLTGEHFFILRDEIVETDVDLLELFVHGRARHAGRSQVRGAAHH